MAWIDERWCWRNPLLTYPAARSADGLPSAGAQLCGPLHHPATDRPKRGCRLVIEHEVRTHKSSEALPREEQLAWKLAEVATDAVPVEPEVAEMVVNRLIDDAGVAAAALRRRPVVNARAQALCPTCCQPGCRHLRLR